MKDKKGLNKQGKLGESFSKKTRNEAYKKLEIYKRKRKDSGSKKLPVQENLKRTSAHEIIQSILYEHKREKEHYGTELHNSLEQILSTLNFYIDALQCAKNVDEKIFNNYLNKIKELICSALMVSHDTAESLMSDQIVEVGLYRALQDLLDNLSMNHKLKLMSKFSLNFDEMELDISKKHEIFKITKIVLQYIISLRHKGVIIINYSFKYKSLLQIEINQRGNILSIDDLESYHVIGYNNLKHQIELFHARVFLNKKLNLIIKIPI